MANYHRYYRIADIIIQLESDLPITDTTFDGRFEKFRAHEPNNDMVTIRHHFELPDLSEQDLGQQVYRKAPWAIYQKDDSWIYLGISPQADDPTLHRVVMFNYDHTHADIYNPRAEPYLTGGLHSLTMFPSDQILIARLLAYRQGCYLHSAGAIMEGAGILFVGHSSAGKSTTMRMLMQGSSEEDKTSCIRTEILCDDRNIVRRWDSGWRAYGTWSHGEIPEVSAASAPLRAVCFLQQANENKLILLLERKEIIRRLLACVIKPFVTADWWHHTIDLIEHMASEVPCYVMRFDQSGEIVKELENLI